MIIAKAPKVVGEAPKIIAEASSTLGELPLIIGEASKIEALSPHHRYLVQELVAQFYGDGSDH